MLWQETYTIKSGTNSRSLQQLGHPQLLQKQDYENQQDEDSAAESCLWSGVCWPGTSIWGSSLKGTQKELIWEEVLVVHVCDRLMFTCLIRLHIYIPWSMYLHEDKTTLLSFSSLYFFHLICLQIARKNDMLSFR